MMGEALLDLVTSIDTTFDFRIVSIVSKKINKIYFSRAPEAVSNNRDAAGEKKERKKIISLCSRHSDRATLM